MNTDLQIVRNEIAIETAALASIRGVVIKSEEDYTKADLFLRRISDARKKVQTRMGKILDPINEALQEARSLKNEMDIPLKELDSSVRHSMQLYRLEEAKEVERQRREREQQDQKRQAAIEEAREKELKAKTAAMTKRLMEKRQSLEVQAAVAEAKPAPAPVVAARSTQAFIKKARVKDLNKLLAGIVNGNIPAEIVTIDEGALNTWARNNTEYVKGWPGVEVYDDVIIKLRRV